MITKTYTPAIILFFLVMIAKLKETHLKDVLLVHKRTAKYLNEYAKYKNLEDSVFKLANLGGHK